MLNNTVSNSGMVQGVLYLYLLKKKTNISKNYFSKNLKTKNEKVELLNLFGILLGFVEYCLTIPTHITVLR